MTASLKQPTQHRCCLQVSRPAWKRPCAALPAPPCAAAGAHPRHNRWARRPQAWAGCRRRTTTQAWRSAAGASPIVAQGPVTVEGRIRPALMLLLRQCCCLPTLRGRAFKPFLQVFSSLTAYNLLMVIDCNDTLVARTCLAGQFSWAMVAWTWCLMITRWPWRTRLCHRRDMRPPQRRRKAPARGGAAGKPSPDRTAPAAPLLPPLLCRQAHHSLCKTSTS